MKSGDEFLFLGCLLSGVLGGFIYEFIKSMAEFLTDLTINRDK